MNTNSLPFIVLRFKEKKNYNVLCAFASTILKGLTANPDYLNPNPSLAVFTSHINALSKAISRWGDVRNRGAHADLVALRIAAEIVKNDLRSLCHYCMRTTPGDALAFSRAGWQLKSAGSPVGELPGPSNLRVIRFRSGSIPGMIHYRWDKVKGAHAYNVWVGEGSEIIIPPDYAQPHYTVASAGFDDFAVPGTPRWIIVGCQGTNPTTGYTSLAGITTP